jgi:coenzyme F420 biosynthesis associated uncharacterized protein
MPTTPRSELLVVDRHGWIGGNIRTLQQLFGDLDLAGGEAKLIAWEGGAFVGLLARAVLAQFDPFRNALIVVYPNLGELGAGDGLRWLLFHEVTHLAQFRAAPWIPDRITSLGRELLSVQRPGFTRDLAAQLRKRLPDLVGWVRDALEGKAEGSPLIDLLPDEQRRIVLELDALVTLLEGHATHVTELIGQRVLPDYPALRQRIEARRYRPPLIRLLEAIAGIEMKRRQYIVGRTFCETIWDHGGAEALAPAWRGPEWVPSRDELRDPQTWLQRVGASRPA